MKFGIILKLSEKSSNSPLCDKPMFVFDNKGRKLTSLNFYKGYSLTEQSKQDLFEFSENNEKEITYFIVKLWNDSIIIYDENHNLLLKLDRVS